MVFHAPAHLNDPKKEEMFDEDLFSLTTFWTKMPLGDYKSQKITPFRHFRSKKRKREKERSKQRKREKRTKT